MALRPAPRRAARLHPIAVADAARVRRLRRQSPIRQYGQRLARRPCLADRDGLREPPTTEAARTSSLRRCDGRRPGARRGGRIAGDYRAPIERVAIIDVEAFDWNCPQHITPRFTLEEVEVASRPLRDRIAALEAQLRAARPPAAD